jgi:hypothetical protein
MNGKRVVQLLPEPTSKVVHSYSCIIIFWDNNSSMINSELVPNNLP